MLDKTGTVTTGEMTLVDVTTAGRTVRLFNPDTALAVDRQGVRLGRGRGFYDRSLPARDPRARLIAIVRDEELVDELPCDPHDVPMTHALTPARGLIGLPRGEC